MCGIAGFLTPLRLAEPLTELASRMAASLTHRGPDDAGAWADEAAGIALAHRRLSIIDLTQEGHQPMRSACQRYWMIYNGEVYNFADLRKTLESAGHTFRGHSDTEVILAAFSEWGVEGAIPRFNGMFAIALWDARDRALWLARDRVGEKPLYYGWAGRTFLFASELKALRAHPDFVARVDRQALVQYVRSGYVAGPLSIYQDVRKVPPGSIVRVDGNDTAAPRTIPYWRAAEMTRRSCEHPFRGSEADGAKELERLLLSAVKMRMVADVPLGAFLSGGIDSSMVVAAMQAQSRQPVKTFTIGFHEAAFNEATHAKRIAAHLGTEHTELYVTPDEARAVIPELPRIYDEPFADPAQIPTALLARLTRTSVSVSLSGDGGDELFAGYARYIWGRKLWALLRRTPLGLRRPASRVLDRFTRDKWRGASSRSVVRRFRLAERAQKAVDILALDGVPAMYRRFMSLWPDPSRLVRGAVESPDGLPPFGHLDEVVPWMMYADFTGYFPNDILVNVDRAAMAVSLEGRMPFTDNRLVEFAWSLPQNWKLHGNVSKWLLRQVLYRYVPRRLIDRPKMGFGVPIGEWLRGPLREWAGDLLSTSRLEGEGYLDPAPIQRAWHEHDAGIRSQSFALWSILMFEAWLSDTTRLPRSPETERRRPL